MNKGTTTFKWHLRKVGMSDWSMENAYTDSFLPRDAMHGHSRISLGINSSFSVIAPLSPKLLMSVHNLLAGAVPN